MGMFDNFIIDLKGLRSDVVKFQFHLDDNFFAHIEESEFHSGKVDVVLQIKRLGEAFEFDFDTEGYVVLTCDRCLEDMQQNVETKDTVIVKLGKEYEELEDNLIVVPEDKGEINVAWLIYEFIALCLPMKHVHEDGMCNEEMAQKLKEHMVGQSAQVDDNDAKKQECDPRWNDLKRILDNN